MYGTELASETPERRGVGLNRAIHALVDDCSLQKTEATMKHDKYCLKDTEWCIGIMLSTGSAGWVR